MFELNGMKMHELYYQVYVFILWYFIFKFKPNITICIFLFQTLKECTQKMDSDTWNAYHILSNRARSVCYAARQQQFRALTQMTVNKLMLSTSQQLGFIHELKVIDLFSNCAYSEYYRKCLCFFIT